MVADTLQRLRKKGVLVALDDFGSGYASLTHLRSLPVDIIKIDRSFIDTMLADPSSMAIVELVVGLAKKLGLKVTAEGVETFGQVVLLLELGCRSLQGYFFGKPMPALAVAQRLQSQKAGHALPSGVEPATLLAADRTEKAVVGKRTSKRGPSVSRRSTGLASSGILPSEVACGKSCMLLILSYVSRQKGWAANT
jgi:FOG: EAL domain